MFGECQVLIAEGFSCLSHGFDGVMAVGPVGVNVNVPSYVREFYKLGDGTFLRQFYFALVLPDFRWNVLKSQSAVEFFLGGEFLQLIGLGVSYAVFAQLEPSFLLLCSQGDVVLLAAGEILEKRAEGV